MDIQAEIIKFQTILQRAVVTDDDLSHELHTQKRVLAMLGLSDGDISNLIHDRHSRAGIPVAPSVRHNAINYGKYQNLTNWQNTPALRQKSRDAELIQELFVPFGMNAREVLVHAKNASKDEQYHCPGCKADLVLRAGEVNKKHFAHKADTACTGETVVHETAKYMVAQVIIEHADPLSTAVISINCSCVICKKTFQRALPKNSFTDAKIEHKIGRFFCDVVAFRGHDHVLAVEVCVTNAVNEQKSEELTIPWIEVDATSILENPYRWNPTQSRLKTVLCHDCKESITKLKTVATKWDLPLSDYAGYRDPSKADYLAAVAMCWKCKEDTLMYWWSGVPFCDSTPPQPVPRTVQLKFSKVYGGKYWVNCCANCGSIQGDNFVFLASDSPFAGLPLRELPQEQERRKHQTASAVSAFMRVIDKNFGR